MGRPTLWVLTVMSGLMTLGGVFVAYQSEMKLVFPGLFFAFCTATFVVKLWRTRLSRAPIE
jgi:hypothetical protein